nr:ubiquitin-like-specific protease 1D isoform X1 [Ipomoea batatas]
MDDDEHCLPELPDNTHRLRNRFARAKDIPYRESSKTLTDGGEEVRQSIKRLLQNALERRQRLRDQLRKEVVKQEGHDHIGAGPPALLPRQFNQLPPKVNDGEEL